MVIKLNCETLLTFKTLHGISLKAIEILINQLGWESEIDFCEFRELYKAEKSSHRSKGHLDAQLFNKQLSRVKSLFDAYNNQGIKTVSMFEPHYPKRLATTKKQPMILHYYGDMSDLEVNKTVAVIGTREATSFGLKVANRTGYYLGRMGCIVTSGLAIGCDMNAHIGCLNANGMTMAILPSGIDNIMPKRNTELADRIVSEGGCLISEYCGLIEPQKHHYIERDQLISTFSDGIMVIETDLTGGTMHTVNFGLVQGKKIACYKHPSEFSTSPQSRGNRSLMSSGKATAFESEDDIINFVQSLRNLETHNLKERNDKQISIFDK